MSKLKIGIIGCGTIGTAIALQCTKHFNKELVFTALYDVADKNINNLQKKLDKKIRVNSIKELFEKSDLVVESAGKDVVAEMLRSAIKYSKNLMLMSIGGIVGNEDLLEAAEKKGIKVYLPSGALAGIDAIKAAGFAKIKSVKLTTFKPPKGLAGAEYIVQNNIDLDKIKRKTTVFRGTVVEAVQGFPKNINVAAVLSLAGIGMKKTQVQIVIVPTATRNSHQIEVEGDFGKITTRTDNLPSPSNPKTSYLASLSAVATISGIVKNVKIGT